MWPGSAKPETSARLIAGGANTYAESRGENAMSKGTDIKKETKKKPAKTLKEKKAEKKIKKETKGSLI